SPSAPVADVCHVAGVTYCALNPTVNDRNVDTTICIAGWTKRPPLSMTDGWKQALLDAYHLPGTIKDYEGDHREGEQAEGGDPGAYPVVRNGVTTWVLTTQTITLPTGVKVPQNFSLEAPPSPNPKDADELTLHDQVCHLKKPYLTLTQARTQLRDK